MDVVVVVATQVHFTRVRDLLLERFPERSMRHCWPAQGVLVFTGDPGPVVDLICEYNWLRNGVVQCYAGTDALGAALASALADVAAAAPPPTAAEVAAAKHAACHVSKKRQPRDLMTPAGAQAAVDVLLAAHPEVATRVCRVTAWPKPVSALVLAALTARGVRLSATVHEVTVSLILYEVGDDSSKGGRKARGGRGGSVGGGGGGGGSAGGVELGLGAGGAASATPSSGGELVAGIRCVAAVYECASLPQLPLHWLPPASEGDDKGGFVCRAEYKLQECMLRFPSKFPSWFLGAFGSSPSGAATSSSSSLSSTSSSSSSSSPVPRPATSSTPSALSACSPYAAVDVGAAPGGWTRLLARACAPVYAIDPANLDPDVVALPNVVHIKGLIDASGDDVVVPTPAAAAAAAVAAASAAAAASASAATPAPGAAALGPLPFTPGTPPFIAALTCDAVMLPGDAGAALARLAPWCLPGALLVLTCKLQKHRSEAGTARDAEEGVAAALAGLGPRFGDFTTVWLMTNRSERTLIGRLVG